MGAINWIDSNPTTAVIHANEARDAQQAQIENQLLAARDQRRAAADADRNSALAANAMLAKPQRSALETATPAALMYDEMGTPVPATELAKATPGATIPQAAPKQSALSTVTADDPYARVNAALQGQRGAGAMLLQNAQAQRKQADAGMLEVMKAMDAGDFDKALILDKHYGTGQSSVISDPNQRAVVRRVIQSIPKNATADQALAYQDAAVRAWGETFKATGDRNEADRAAGAAGIKAAMAAQGKADAYFQDDAGNVTAVRGGKATPVEGARGRTTRFAGGGGAGGSPKAVATMEWKSKSYQALGISPELSNAIAANPGFATTPQAVQKQAQFIQKASADVMGRPTKTADQAMQEARQLMQGAQSMALETMGGTSPVKPSAPAAPQGRVRRYVPGQGFVDQQ